jgi:hypothetical protein
VLTDGDELARLALALARSVDSEQPKTKGNTKFMKTSVVAKSALSLLLVSLMLVTSACSVSGTELLDAAVSAADATVAVLSTTNLIPPQDQAYVSAVLDGLNFATQELGSKKSGLQIAVDIVTEFKNAVVPDLTGLTSAQSEQVKALAAAVAAFLTPFEQVVPAGGQAPAFQNKLSGQPKLTLELRLHLFELRHKIAGIQKRALHVFVSPAK